MKKKIGLLFTLILLLVVIVWLFIRDDGLRGISATLKSFGVLRFLSAIAVSCLITAGGAIRYWVLVNDVGHKVSFRDANRIFVSGAFGSLAFFQFYGQTAVRSALMKRHGITPEDVLIISIIEKAAGMLVLLTLTAVAGGYLISDLFQNAHIPGHELAMVAITVFIITAIVVRLLRPVLKDIGLGFLANTIGRAGVKALVISLVMYGLTLSVFLAFLAPLESTGNLRAEISVALIVMFAASIPISFSGWGLREISAAFVFSLIGLSVSQSVAVSVAVGLSSLLALLLYSLITWRKDLFSADSEAPPSEKKKVREKKSLIPRGIFALSVGCAVAVLVLFQIKLPLGSGFVLVNLADPVVIFSSVVSVLVFFQKSKEGVLSFRLLPVILLAVGILVFVAGAVNGILRFGYTEWALINKTTGIFLLIGYSLCGVYAARIGSGFSAGIIIPKIFVVSVAVVVAVSLLTEMGDLLAPGILSGVPQRMEGFSKNPNAFGFQLCIALALIVGFLNAKQFRSTGWIFASGLVFLGAYESKSRAAILVVLALFVVLILLKIHRPVRHLLSAIGASVVLLFPAALFEWVSSYLGSMPNITGLGYIGRYLQGIFQHMESVAAVSISGKYDSFRWETITGGFEMFLENPVFGAGLGAYYLKSGTEGLAFVIHSTPVWILAEFGLIGIAVFCAGLVLFLKYGAMLMKSARKTATQDFDQGVAIVLMVVVFVVSGIPHEMFFQRPFWFLIGVCASGLFVREKLETFPELVEISEAGTGKK